MKSRIIILTILLTILGTLTLGNRAVSAQDQIYCEHMFVAQGWAVIRCKPL